MATASRPVPSTDVLVLSAAVIAALLLSACGPRSPAARRPAEPHTGYREPADCKSRSLPRRCEDQFEYLHTCPSGKQPPSMSKITGGRIDPRKRNPSPWVSVRLHEKHTKGFLERVRALGASHVSAYGPVVFMSIPPKKVLCVAELPEVRQIEDQDDKARPQAR